MIDEFLLSWSLFHNSYLAGWLIAAMLSVVGVLVVARNQIFIGAAVSQASVLGIASGMWLSTSTLTRCAWCQSDGFLSLMGGIFAVAAALFVGRGGGEPGRSDEAMTGWLFLVAGSLSVLILSHSPHGLEEVHRLASSSIIGASGTDVWLFVAMTAGTFAMIASARRKLVLLLMDREMAQAVGLHVRTWDVAISVWLGMVVGLSIRVSGMTYTFGCLVLPALAARAVCRNVSSMFWVVAPVAVATGLAGFVLANYWDYPPAQVTVTLLGAVLAVLWVERALRAGGGS